MNIFIILKIAPSYGHCRVSRWSVPSSSGALLIGLYVPFSLFCCWTFGGLVPLFPNNKEQQHVIITFYILHFTAWAGYPNSLLICLIIILSPFLITSSSPSFWFASLEFYYLLQLLWLACLYPIPSSSADTDIWFPIFSSSPSSFWLLTL